LYIKRAGTEEVTLTNEGQKTPFDINVIINTVNKTGSMTINIKDFESMNAVQYLHILKYYKIINKKISMYVMHAESSVKIMETNSFAGITISVPDRLFTAVEDLAEIQKRVHKIIDIPHREFTYDEIRNIIELQNILHKGEVNYTWSELEIPIKPTSPESIQNLDKTHHMFRFESDYQKEMFGTVIPLGIGIHTIYDAIIENIDEIKRQVKEGDEVITLKMRPGTNNSSKTEFLDWQKAADTEAA
jgi:hypothetical protein